LYRFGKELKDVIDLILESSRKHLIGLIKEKLPNAVQTESTAVDHVSNATGSSNDNVHTGLKGTNVITDSGTTNTGMDLDVHVVTEGDNYFLNLLGKLTGGGEDKRLALTKLRVELSKGSNRESRGFTLLCDKMISK
jgi:hypothetical protein